MSSLKVSSENLDEGVAHVRAFADAFLAPDVARRWLALLEKASPAAWRKIEPWDVWDESKRGKGGRFVDIKMPIEQLKSDYSLCPDPSVVTIVVGLGHAKPDVLRKPFRDLSGVDWPIEGIVSLDAGRRVFVTNHSGDVILCTR